MIKWDLFQGFKDGSDIHKNVIHHINKMNKNYMIISTDIEKKHLTKLNSDL